MKNRKLKVYGAWVKDQNCECQAYSKKEAAEIMKSKLHNVYLKAISSKMIRS